MHRSASVDQFMEALDHARKPEVQQLRLAILASDDGLTETIKWNAPNFVFAGEDRVTFRLKPGDRVELVLHRGAKVRDDTAGFHFDDPTGAIKWATPDRGVITITDQADLTARQQPILELITRWIQA